MLIPSKHENLHRNLLVIGADIISFLKKKPYNIEDLFQEIKNNNSVGVNQYYNALTFLSVADVVDVDSFSITLKNKNK